ncbi:MAG: cytidine deaminase [Actinomycetes bacterium]
MPVNADGPDPHPLAPDAVDPDALDPEDAKILTLARSARPRGYAPHTGQLEGACVRDTDGRTYLAATVENADPSLTVSALRAAVVAAASSGARSFEAAALVTEGAGPVAEDVRTLVEFTPGVPLFLAGPDGVAHSRVEAR